MFSSARRIDFDSAPSSRGNDNEIYETMASWGDINAALNRLVREGVITGFKTNRGEKSHQAGLHVNVVPSSGGDVEGIRSQILAVLTPLDDEVTVTVGAEAAAGG